MHSLQVLNKQAITEGAATEAIFNACRGNEDRANTVNVHFERLYRDVYHVRLYCADGKPIAMAIIDEYDV